MGAETPNASPLERVVIAIMSMLSANGAEAVTVVYGSDRRPAGMRWGMEGRNYRASVRPSSVPGEGSVDDKLVAAWELLYSSLGDGVTQFENGQATKDQAFARFREPFGFFRRFAGFLKGGERQATILEPVMLGPSPVKAAE